MSDLKATIGIGLDGTGIKVGVTDVNQTLATIGPAAKAAGAAASQGIDQIADQAEKTAGKVKGSAKKIKDALADASTQTGATPELPIGPAADKAVVKVDRATKSMISRLQSTTAEITTLGRGSSDYFEKIASIKGLDGTALAPYLAELRAAEKAQEAMRGSLGNTGMSAKATANALRQVPAQFTDIVVSLQGGQAPLTVLLQQGGQLKDIFGGVGAAAKAMAGYIGGVITNPYVLVAAGLGALAYGYYEGSKEASNYNKALISTGGAAGVSAGQLQAMAASMAKIGGTQSQAAEALTAFAASGQVGAQNLERFSTAAVRYSKATGTAISDTVDKFAELGRSPVEGSRKLNEQTNYLTASVYKQIKALEDQGLHVKAVELAQRTLADSLEQNTGRMVQNLGVLEKMWKAIKEDAAEASGVLLSAGRTALVPAQIANLNSDKKAAQTKLDKFAALPGIDAERQVKSQEAIIRALDVRLTSLSKIALKTQEISEIEAANVQREKDQKIFDARVDANRPNLGPGGKRELALTKLKNEATATGVVADPGALAHERALIEKQFDTGANLAAVKIAEDQKLQVIARAQEQINLIRATGGTTERGIIADTSKLELAAIDVRIQAAEKERALAASKPDNEAAVENAKVALAALKESRKTAELKGINAVIEARYAEYQIIKEQSLAVDNSARQIAVELQYAAASDSVRAQKLNDLRIEIELEDKLKKIKANGGAAADQADQIAIAKANALLEKQNAIEKDTAKYRNEATKAARAFADTLADGNAEMALSVQLVGATDRERALENEKLKIRLALSKQIRDVEESSRTDGEKAADIRALNARAELETASVTSKSATQYWVDASREIQSALTDGIINGLKADGIQGAIRGLRDSLVNEFANLVLRPTIQGIMAPIAQGVAGAFGISGPSGSAAGGSSGGALSALGSIGSAFGSSFSAGFAGTMSAGFSGMGASLAGGFAQVTSGTVTGLASGFGQILGTLGPIALGVGAVIALSDAMQYKIDSNGSALVAQATSKGTSKVDTRSDFTQTGGLFGGGVTHNSSWADAGSSVKTYFDASIQATTASIKKYAAALGLAPEAVDSFTKQIEISITGLSPEQQQAAINKALGQFANEMVSSAYGAALGGLAHMGEAAGSTLERLAIDLTVVTGALSALGLAALGVGLSGAAASAALVDAFGGLDKFNASVTSYYEKFYSDGEKTTNGLSALSTQFAALHVSVPASREDFRRLVDGLDLTTEAGRTLFASLLGLAPAFDAVTTAVETTVKKMVQEAAGMLKNYGTPEALRNFQVHQIGESLRAGGIQVEDGTIAVASRADFYKEYNARVAAGDKKGAAALMGQQQNFADITQPTAAPTAPAMQQTVTYQPSVYSEPPNLVEAAKGAGAAAAAVADPAIAERIQLQTQLNALTDTAAQALARQRDAIQESNRALFDQIQEAKKANAIADERTKLQSQLNGATDTAAQALARQRDALDESNRSLFDQIQLSLKANAIADERAKLQDQLNGTTDTAAQALTRQRDALDESNRSLFDQVQAATQAKQAMDAFNSAMSNLQGQNNGLQVQLLTANGDVRGAAALTRKQYLDALTNLSPADLARVATQYDANVALQQQIDAVTAANQAAATAASNAASAASALKSAWQSLTDSIFGEVARIRGLIADASPDSLAGAQAQFAIATAQARAGDQEAAKLLPALSQTLLTLAEANATTLAELQRIRGTTAASLDTTGGILAGQYGLNVPHLATGTNLVPDDMLAVIHKGEAVVPASYNPALGFGNSNNDDMLAELRALRLEITALRAAQLEGNVYGKTASESLSGRSPMVVQVINAQGVLQ